jgi:type IV pilus assembly protein PilA
MGVFLQMKELKKRFLKNFQAGEKGFTLIELLIVIAILGILAAVIIPNITGFITSGKVSAANSELAAIQTASEAYQSEYPTAAAFTESSGNNILSNYLSKAPSGTYVFLTGAVLDTATATPKYVNGGTTLHWNATSLQFTR